MAAPYAGNPLSGHFGYFQAAVNDPAVRAQPGGVQQYVWQAISNEFLARGEPLPPGSFQAVNQLLGLAGQQRRAADQLAAARLTLENTGLDQAVTGSMAADSLDARALSDRVGGTQHRVIYMSQEIVGGEPVLSYRTLDVGYDLPQSLTALQDAADAAAQIEAADYGYEWGGVAVPVAIHAY